MNHENLITLQPLLGYTVCRGCYICMFPWVTRFLLFLPLITCVQYANLRKNLQKKKRWLLNLDFVLLINANYLFWLTQSITNHTTTSSVCRRHTDTHKKRMVCLYCHLTPEYTCWFRPLQDRVIRYLVQAGWTLQDLRKESREHSRSNLRY